MKAIYCRVSTDEQADGTSLQEQERVCRGAAMMVSTEEPLIYTDAGVKGVVPLACRPAGKRMMADLKAGDTVIVAKLDRAFRSARDALNTLESMREKGVHVILCDLGTSPVTGNGTARLLFGILASVAEFERDRIKERQIAGQQAKRAKGGHVGGEPPFGFRVVGQGKRAELVPHENEQAALRTMIELRKKMSLRKMVRELSALGIRTREGGVYHPENIRRILARNEGNNGGSSAAA